MHCMCKLPTIFVGQKKCDVNINQTMIKTGTTNKLRHGKISYFSDAKVSCWEVISHS